MEVPDRHVRVNLMSTITNQGAVRFMTSTQTMTAAVVIVLLGRLLRSTTGKLFLIVARLRVPAAAAVEAWVATQEQRLERFYLPRYAPERNADDYWTTDVKGGVNAQGLPANKPELRWRMQAFRQRLVHVPEHVRNYFCHPDVQYAAAL